MDWHTLLVALALVIIIEGIMPFVNPNGYRRMMEAVSHTDSGKLRIGGAMCMVIGLVVLYLGNN